MTHRFQIGRITFGPRHEEERQLLDTSGPLLVAPKGMPITTMALDRLESTIDRVAEEITGLRADKVRLTSLLLLAEAALAHAAEATPGQSLYEYIRDRIRLELGRGA